MGFLGTRRPRLARWSWKICLAGCVLTILAVPFYMMGVNALVDLAGYANWLSWRPVFWLAVVGACLPVLPTIMYFIVRPPPAPRPPAPKPGTGKMTTPPAKNGGKDKHSPPTTLKSGNP
jgi:hypothetical protein